MLAVVYVLILVFPASLSVWMLRELDRAAKCRGGLLDSAKIERSRFRFLIVDFFSLMFLLQIPFTALTQDQEGQSFNNEISIVWTFAIVAILLIWWTMINTVSRAGILAFRWRAAISLIVIPTSFIGCFFFPAGLIGIMTGKNATLQMYAFVVLTGIGLVVSPFLVKGAINSVELKELGTFASEENASVEIADPYSD